MKIQVLSDLHNEFHKHPPDIEPCDADVVVLAGDIDVGNRGIIWASRQSERLGVPVIYVAGNHEFYGGDYLGTLHGMRETARAAGIYFLEKNIIKIGEIGFAGTTLWTDFCGLGIGYRSRALAQAQISMVDYVRIEIAGRRLYPQDIELWHEHSLRWLLDRQAQGVDVVVTHHGPSPKCHDERSHGAPTPFSTAFWSDMETEIATISPKLWVYGHTHSNLSFDIGATRVTTNQRGYPGERVGGEPFDPRFIVEL